MPCATGKTLIGIETARELRSKTIIILAPTIILLAQLLRDWTHQLELFEYLCVCSDDTVEDENRRMAKEILSEMQHVSTDVSDIIRFLDLSTDRRKIVFTTYQSYSLIKIACQNIGHQTHFDLAIADEAHHCAGWRGRPFSSILNDDVSIDKRLFMTATPRFIMPSGRSGERVILSMNDENAFGPVFHQLSFSRARELDLLCDYQVAVIMVHPDLYRNELNAAIASEDPYNEIDVLRYHACHIALAYAMRQCNLRNVLSYHNRVHAAKQFSQDFAQFVAKLPKEKRPKQPVWSEYISGEMDPEQRNDLLAQFRARLGHATRLLCNARCLTEGIDVPNIDGIIFADPRQSIIDITQCIGRALRKKDHTKVATIIVPVFMKDTEDTVLEIQESDYCAVWNVLDALGSIDDAMTQDIKEMDRFAAREGFKRVKLPPKVHQYASLNINTEFLNAISIKLFNRHITSWDKMLGLLERYTQREGTSQVPERHMENSYNLGVWVMTQRRHFKKKKLTNDRIRQLESLPGWVWSLRKSYFEHGIGHYRTYLQEHGNGLIPRNYVAANGFKLGEWLHDQRKKYRHRKLTDTQCKQLGDESIWLSALQRLSWEDAWLKGYMHLVRFEARNGHCRVPWNHKEEGFPLDRWMTTQRRKFRRGRMTSKYQELLLRIPGWKWNPKDDKWQEYLYLLQQFAKREGHCSVPLKHCENGKPLGLWCQRQKRNYSRKKLSQDQIRDLESLTGWAW